MVNLSGGKPSGIASSHKINGESRVKDHYPKAQELGQRHSTGLQLRCQLANSTFDLVYETKTNHVKIRLHIPLKSPSA